MGESADDRDARLAGWNTGFFRRSPQSAAGAAEAWVEHELDEASGRAHMQKRQGARRMLRDFDVDGDGQVGLREFIDGLPVSVAMTERVCERAFLVLDQDEDGYLDAEELMGAHPALRAASLEESAHELADALLGADKDGDHMLSRAELQIIKNAWVDEDGPGESVRSVIREFDAFDHDGDRRLDAEELQRAIMSLLDRNLF